MNYSISVYKLGTVTNQCNVEGDKGPIHALKVYASRQGREIECQNLEYFQNGAKKYWEMYEADGIRIVVKEVSAASPTLSTL